MPPFKIALLSLQICATPSSSSNSMASASSSNEHSHEIQEEVGIQIPKVKKVARKKKTKNVVEEVQTEQAKKAAKKKGKAPVVEESTHTKKDMKKGKKSPTASYLDAWTQGYVTEEDSDWRDSTWPEDGHPNSSENPRHLFPALPDVGNFEDANVHFGYNIELGAQVIQHITTSDLLPNLQKSGLLRVLSCFESRASADVIRTIYNKMIHHSDSDYITIAQDDTMNALEELKEKQGFSKIDGEEDAQQYGNAQQYGHAAQYNSRFMPIHPQAVPFNLPFPQRYVHGNMEEYVPNDLSGYDMRHIMEMNAANIAEIKFALGLPSFTHTRAFTPPSTQPSSHSSTSRSTSQNPAQENSQLSIRSRRTTAGESSRGRKKSTRNEDEEI